MMSRKAISILLTQYDDKISFRIQYTLIAIQHNKRIKCLGTGLSCQLGHRICSAEMSTEQFYISQF